MMWLHNLIDKFKENQQGFLTIIIPIMLFTCILLLFFKSYPPESKDILTLVTGAITAKFVAICNYWFGSSSGSARKTDLLSKENGTK